MFQHTILIRRDHRFSCVEPQLAVFVVHRWSWFNKAVLTVGIVAFRLVVQLQFVHHSLVIAEYIELELALSLQQMSRVLLLTETPSGCGIGILVYRHCFTFAIFKS